jgi:hypothetical protein
MPLMVRDTDGSRQRLLLQLAEPPELGEKVRSSGESNLMLCEAIATVLCFSVQFTYRCVSSQVLSSVTVNNTIVCDVTPCSLVEIMDASEERNSFRLQG